MKTSTKIKKKENSEKRKETERKQLKQGKNIKKK